MKVTIEPHNRSLEGIHTVIDYKILWSTNQRIIPLPIMESNSCKVQHVLPLQYLDKIDAAGNILILPFIQASQYLILQDKTWIKNYKQSTLKSLISSLLNLSFCCISSLI